MTWDVSLIPHCVYTDLGDFPNPPGVSTLTRNVSLIPEVNLLLSGTFDSFISTLISDVSLIP